ncbi:50S ribosomal protein L6 [Candidatus Micrarchaeota archaeon CG1_02_55_22]|nr:MAG: 50S ribosomal protein L6 [Candidatus Micrarchaeota archaeon CG1_02_55_22]
MKIPEGITLNVEGNMLVVKGPKGGIKKVFDNETVNVTIKDGEVTFSTPLKARRKVNAAVNTVRAHVRNMFEGASNGYVQKLSVIYSHFPITVEAKPGEVLIKNFLGEKSVRRARVMGSVKVEVKKQDITVSGSDKEEVGQTAANMHLATRIVGRDNRKFQDGIYLVQ